MAMKQGKDAYAYVMLRENNKVQMRRVRAVEIQTAAGDVRYFSGAKIPFHGIVLDCGEQNRKGGGAAQILGVPTERIYVDPGPAWPVGRLAVIAFAIIGIVHALRSFVVALN